MNFSAHIGAHSGGQRRTAVVVVLLAFAGFFAVSSGAPKVSAAADCIGAGPLFDRFSLTLDEGIRTEAAGPFFYKELKDSQRTWAVPPLLCNVSDPDVESHEFDLAYPFLTYDRYGAEYRFQIFQLLSFSGGGLQSGATEDRFTLFPLYFQQRSVETNENYTALFPLYGTLKNRLFRNEISFVLWPLYVKTIRSPGAGTVGAGDFLSLGNHWAKGRRGDITTYNFVAPIFHLRYGDGLRGWQFWPLAGHEEKVVTTRTNSWGDEEIVPGHKSSFVLWPLWLNETSEIGTTNASSFRGMIPFYAAARSPGRDSTTYLWPFGLTRTDDRDKKYRETDVFWPLFVYARGEGKTATRVWPLFNRSHNESMESNFYLWPLYKYNRLHADPLDRERTQILFFLYSDWRQKNTDTGKTARRIDCWPLFTQTRDFSGNSRLQVLSLIEPIFSKSKSIDRNYSPIWSVWRSENNPGTGATSQSLLWNLYRHQVNTDGTRKTSFLFGLFQHRSTPSGSGLRLFFIPVKKVPASAAPAVDSPGEIKHLPPAAKP